MNKKRSFDVDIVIDVEQDRDPASAEHGGRPAAPAPNLNAREAPVSEIRSSTVLESQMAPAPDAAGAGRPEDASAARTPAQSAGAVSLLFLPLCMTLVVNALVLQAAALQRSQGVADDALPGALLDYLHPGAAACLAISYGFSVGIIVAAITRQAKANREHAADAGLTPEASTKRSD